MISKAQVKYIQSLGQKKHRDEEGLFVAEGPKLVRELLVSNHVTQLFATEDWLKENENWFLKLWQNDDSKILTEISDSELERISQFTSPNQVVAVAKKFPIEEPMIKGKISLLLDRIQDPGNMGTIIRTADWFGINQLICSNDCAELYNPKVIQATMGSIIRVKVFYTDLLVWLKKRNDIRIYATMLEGKDISKMGKLSEGLVMIGNESKGISEELLEFANEKITIAKKGGSESLNAAVATGIVLSHLV